MEQGRLKVKKAGKMNRKRKEEEMTTECACSLRVVEPCFSIERKREGDGWRGYGSEMERFEPPSGE